MGTRGTFGFAIDGGRKIAYNHWDSYPSGLGLTVLRWLRSALDDRAALTEKARALRVVRSEDAEPSDEEVEALKEFYDGSVDRPSGRPTWYQLLRRTQGDPDAILRAGVVEDGSGFGGIEWTYLIDLDAGTFVAGNNYGDGASVTWALSDPPDDDAFMAALADKDDDE